MNGHEKQLATHAGAVGAAMVYWELRRKLLDTIALAYPWLAQECKRQSGEQPTPIPMINTHRACSRISSRSGIPRSRRVDSHTSLLLS